MSKIFIASAFALSLLATRSEAYSPQSFSPFTAASVHDEPLDGLGDSFNAPPLEGLIYTQFDREDRAMLKFGLGNLEGATILSATLTGRIGAINSASSGIRKYDFVMWNASPVDTLSDFQEPGAVVGTAQYEPPLETSFVFQFDVTAQVQAIAVPGGGSVLGLRVQGTTVPGFQSGLDGTTCTLDVVTAPPAISSFCSGDGTATPCPCGNQGAPGFGCANSAFNSGGSIGASGTPSVSGSFVIGATGLIPSVPGLYFEGTSQKNGGNGAIFGDGLLCLAGQITRLQVITTSPSGDSVSNVHIPSLSGVSAGETRYYQLWFRDPIQLTCGNGFNFTNGLSVTWSL